MITTALVIAILVLAGFTVLFYKLPVWLRRFLSRRYILLDIFLCIFAFWTLSFTLVGIIAAGFISLFVSIYLLCYKKMISKELVKREKIKTHNCKPHVRWAARCYNLWR